jgi:hypothetical protein
MKTSAVENWSTALSSGSCPMCGFDSSLCAVAGSPEVVDEGMSEVRRARALAGNPGSAAAITTDIKTMLNRTLDDVGHVVEVWLASRRFTQGEDGAAEVPKGGTRSVILVWENGDWKHTVQKRWTSRGTSPSTFDPDSPAAWTDG